LLKARPTQDDGNSNSYRDYTWIERHNVVPALARSEVGFALGCGANVSRDSAGVCLLGNDLTQLPWIIELARRTVRVIRQNLFWAFFYNALGIGLGCTGRLNPVLAALAMTLSSLLVVVNSLRLSRFGAEPEAPPGVVSLEEAGVTRCSGC
jgi:cation transport ATPase